MPSKRGRMQVWRVFKEYADNPLLQMMTIAELSRMISALQRPLQNAYSGISEQLWRQRHAAFRFSRSPSDWLNYNG